MATVTFWDNHGYKGMSDTYNGAQRKSFGGSKAYDSLKNGSNTWLVLWDGDDYTGNYLKINPGEDKDNLDSISRGSDTWKGAVKSMIIYANQPSWWNQNSTPPNNDLNLQPHDAVFCTNTDFNDDTIVYTANVSKSDLNDESFPTNTGKDLKNDIQSLATGSSAWLEIWNDTSYSGSYLRVKPSTKYGDLNQVPRLPSGDWKNQMQSFKLYNYRPDDTWLLGFDTKKFFDAFPDAVKLEDSSGTYYHYLTQDCGYDIRITNVSYDSATMTISFRIDYDLDGHNDKVNLDLTVNTDGSFNSVSYEYEQGGAVQIPKSVIKAVDVSVEVLGAVGALETAGISEEAADAFIEAFDTFCKVFNKVSNVLYKLSEANDGRFYLCAVVTHVLCRALSAVTIEE